MEELDLEDNLIGEVGGREVMDGLSYRKERKCVYVCVCVCVCVCFSVSACR